MAVTPPVRHIFRRTRLVQSVRIIERGCHWFTGAVQTGWTRLVLDRTRAPAGYALTEITRTSEQPVEEGGQKEEGEKKKEIERVTELEKEREETSTVV